MGAVKLPCAAYRGNAATPSRVGEALPWRVERLERGDVPSGASRSRLSDSDLACLQSITLAVTLLRRDLIHDDVGRPVIKGPTGGGANASGGTSAPGDPAVTAR